MSYYKIDAPVALAESWARWPHFSLNPVVPLNGPNKGNHHLASRAVHLSPWSDGVEVCGERGVGGFWGSQAGPPALRCNIHSTNVTTFHSRHVEKGLGSWAPPSNLTVFPDRSTRKESACNAGDPGLYSWVRKICWRSDRLPTPLLHLFQPGEFHGLYSPRGHKELDTTERLSLSLHESNISAINRFQLPPLDCTTFVNNNLKSLEKAVKN